MNPLFGWIRRKLNLSDPTGWPVNGRSASRRSVNQATGLTLAAAWACVRRKSDTAGTLPLQIFRPNDKGTADQIQNHALSYPLRARPNPDFTSPRLWSATVGALDLWGNGYHEKLYGSQNQVVGLDWLYPSHMSVDRRGGLLIYDYTDPVTRRRREIPRDDIIHYRGFDLGGDKGASAIEYGVSSLGSAMDAEEAAGNYFANGMMSGGWLVKKGKPFTDDQRSEFRNNVIAPVTGSQNAGKWGTLEGDIEPHPFEMNPEESQLLETRRFDVETVCRWFDTPPILIGHSMAGQTMWGTGVGEIVNGWYYIVIQPLLTKIENELQAALLTPADKAAGVFFRFNFDAIMRADPEKRSNYLAMMVDKGLMTRNEARAKLNLPPKPGGDVLTAQSQFVPIETLGKTPQVAQIGAPQQ